MKLVVSVVVAPVPAALRRTFNLPTLLSGILAAIIKALVTRVPPIPTNSPQCSTASHPVLCEHAGSMARQHLNW